MTPKDAQTRIAKLLGKRAAWRDTGRRTSPDQRAEAASQREVCSERRRLVKDALEARRQALLAADTEYQRLLAEFTAAKQAEALAGRGGGYRITVGLDMGFAFEVRAEGDNWAEVVRALEMREPNQITVARVS